MIKELSPDDASTREPFNPLRQAWRRGCAVQEHLDRPHLGDTKSVSETLVRHLGEPSAVIHVPSVNQPFTLSRVRADLLQGHPVQTWDMDDRWPQRRRFKALMDEWRKRQGLTIAETAGQLGLTYNTLRQYTSPARRDTKPSIELLQKATTLFGCSLTEFVDDPGAPPDGAAPDSSEVDRFMLRIIGIDLSKLTDREKQAAFEAWRSIIRGYEKA